MKNTTAEHADETDLSQFVRASEVVLFLGNVDPQRAYQAAEIAGSQGGVIVVDNQQVSPRVSANIEFRRGTVQDLQLDLSAFDLWLQSHPARSSSDWLQAEAFAAELRRTAPLIQSESIDLVVCSNALNLIDNGQTTQLLAELYRVLKRGGRVIFTDTVSDEDLPPHYQLDASLNRACREDRLLSAFEEAGFHGMEILAWPAAPSQTVAGIEFRKLTIRAFKGKDGPCLERNQAVIYKGPWKAVIDDDGHTLYRGRRMAVCDKTFQIYTQSPYAGDIAPIPPAHEIPLEQAEAFDCRKNAVRDPHETKGATHRGVLALPISGDCGPNGCC